MNRFGEFHLTNKKIGVKISARKYESWSFVEPVARWIPG